ncbi:MAG: hypothetical protein ACI81P_002325 [Neolewinella sp.]|jgi:hypothetical protein
MRNTITPRNFALALFTFFSLISLCVSGQDQLPAADWQADLDFLQETVHKDYSFLFKKTTAGVFDKKVAKLSASIPTMQQHEIIAGFARIVSSFEYGHTSLRLGGGDMSFHQLPINLYHFSDGVYVEGVHQGNQQALGARVLKIAGMPIAEALVAIRPIVPAENDQFFKGYGLQYLSFPEVLHAQGVTKELQEEVVLTLEKDGDIFDMGFSKGKMGALPTSYGFTKQEGEWRSAREQGTTPHYLRELDKHYYFDYLPEAKTMYVRYSQVVPDPSMNIPDFYESVFNFIDSNEVDKLVLDVRLNGGGNNFNNKTLVTKVIRSEKINQIGKFYVIIGRRTFSACQNLINEFDNYTNVIFVGEPSSENVNFYGDNRTVELPNSQLEVRLSWAWWQDKPQWQNADWTVPQLAVDMSFEEYRMNQDPILEQALNFKPSDFILDPMDHLTDLFVAGKMDQVAKDAKRFVTDPAYRFFKFEEEFTKVGTMLLRSKQLRGAQFVFQMLTDFFPESAGGYDNLAEAFLRSDDPVQAKALSEKAVQLDPDGEIGERARMRLKLLMDD